jgi:hypothetical protein
MSDRERLGSCPESLLAEAIQVGTLQAVVDCSGQGLSDSLVFDLRWAGERRALKGWPRRATPLDAPCPSGDRPTSKPIDFSQMGASPLHRLLHGSGLPHSDGSHLVQRTNHSGVPRTPLGMGILACRKQPLLRILRAASFPTGDGGGGADSCCIPCSRNRCGCFGEMGATHRAPSPTPIARSPFRSPKRFPRDCISLPRRRSCTCSPRSLGLLEADFTSIVRSTGRIDLPSIPKTLDRWRPLA